jgi:hypothetical protein
MIHNFKIRHVNTARVGRLLSLKNGSYERIGKQLTRLLFCSVICTYKSRCMYT